MFRIMGEFSEGFEFISSLKKAVTVFGSARLILELNGTRKGKLGELLAQGNYDVVTGGGRLWKRRTVALLANIRQGFGGLNIQLPREQRVNPYVERSIVFHYFSPAKW